MIGIACALAALARNNVEVEVADLSEERCALAADTLGVRVSHNLQAEYEVVIDAVGAAATRATSVERLRPGGVAVWIGLQDSAPGFDGRALIRHERVVHGAYAYLDVDFDAGLELCGHVSESWIEQVPLADGATRFAELMEAPGPVPKVVVVPKASRRTRSSQE
jgi:threonine dehydrogenase-like Zn-dependent dehydrogenase